MILQIDKFSWIKIYC